MECLRRASVDSTLEDGMDSVMGLWLWILIAPVAAIVGLSFLGGSPRR